MSFNKENIFANINIEIKKPQSLMKANRSPTPPPPKKSLGEMAQVVGQSINLSNYTYRESVRSNNGPQQQLQKSGEKCDQIIANMGKKLENIAKIAEDNEKFNMQIKNYIDNTNQYSENSITCSNVKGNLFNSLEAIDINTNYQGDSKNNTLKETNGQMFNLDQLQFNETSIEQQNDHADKRQSGFFNDQSTLCFQATDAEEAKQFIKICDIIDQNQNNNIDQNYWACQQGSHYRSSAINKMRRNNLINNSNSINMMNTTNKNLMNQFAQSNSKQVINNNSNIYNNTKPQQQAQKKVNLQQLGITDSNSMLYNEYTYNNYPYLYKTTQYIIFQQSDLQKFLSKLQTYEELLVQQQQKIRNFEQELVQKKDSEQVNNITISQSRIMEEGEPLQTDQQINQSEPSQNSINSNEDKTSFSQNNQNSSNQKCKSSFEYFLTERNELQSKIALQQFKKPPRHGSLNPKSSIGAMPINNSEKVIRQYIPSFQQFKEKQVNSALQTQEQNSLKNQIQQKIIQMNSFYIPNDKKTSYQQIKQNQKHVTSLQEFDEQDTTNSTIDSLNKYQFNKHTQSQQAIMQRPINQQMHQQNKLNTSQSQGRLQPQIVQKERSISENHSYHIEKKNDCTIF